MKFIKYQSLGNDFVFLDWTNQSCDTIQKKIQLEDWRAAVKKWCKRYSGVGADGVLLLFKNQNNQDELMLFNADGSSAEKCLNGLRCATHYLFTQKNYPPSFEIVMNHSPVKCMAEERHQSILITENIGKVINQGRRDIVVINKNIEGFFVDVGNPHFVILHEVSLDWLYQFGLQISQNPLFPNQTNVEFVWLNEEESLQRYMPVYDVLVYERACGITRACGTGAAAVLKVLFDCQKIQASKEIIIKMLGGDIRTFVNSDEEIIQKASAELVFTGDV